MNDLIIKNGNVFIDGHFQKVNLTIRDGIITDINSDEKNFEDILMYDAKGNNIVPGFIDIHTHGAINVDVNSATAEDLAKISHYFATQGTTSWLCSILTDTKEQTLWCIDQYNAYKQLNSNGAELMGIHLEGPFLATEYKGAMPEHLLQKADIQLLEEYQKAAHGEIKYITVSPEVEGIPENIRQIINMGMTVAIGHSGADYDTSMKCIQSGARGITHTFNAMKLMHQHAPSIAGAALESDAYCEAICDGRHLHPAIIRLLIKTKGIDRVVAVTDSIMATGLPDGNYKLGVNEVVVIDGDAKVVSTGARAGSTLTTAQSLKNLLEFTNRPLEQIIQLLTQNPANLIGVNDTRGSIAVGKYADLVILNQDNDILQTFVKGSQITDKEKE
ncbi:MAG: N-acetylglucosamine-6-phosphate deacetylase [Clostridiales bacterium]|nr:N-acetylglucosamine-6-phosphate deacetylase [Clostridiales bacterium]